MAHLLHIVTELTYKIEQSIKVTFGRIRIELCQALFNDPSINWEKTNLGPLQQYQPTSVFENSSGAG